MAQVNLPALVSTLTLSDPVTLIHMREQAKPKPSFLIDHLMRTAATDIVRTDTVYIDVKDRRGNKLAPFVATGHKSIERSGYKTHEIKPARIAPSRKISLADTNTRIWLEGIADPKSQEDRAMEISINDMNDLVEATRNTWELMIADLIQTGKYTFTYVKSDKNGDDESEDVTEVDWGKIIGADNWKYTPGKSWGDAAANPLADLCAMARMMRKQGVMPTTLLVGANVASALLQNEKVLKLLDNRRIEIGGINPRIVAQGGAIIGNLVLDGVNVAVVDYAGEYENARGETKPYIDPDNAVLVSEGGIRALFAAVTQIENCGENFVTRFDAMVPKFISDLENDTFKMMLTSRPAFAPQVLGTFVCAKAVFTA